MLRREDYPACVLSVGKKGQVLERWFDIVHWTPFLYCAVEVEGLKAVAGGLADHPHQRSY